MKVLSSVSCSCLSCTTGGLVKLLIHYCCCLFLLSFACYTVDENTIAFVERKSVLNDLKILPLLSLPLARKCSSPSLSGYGSVVHLSPVL